MGVVLFDYDGPLYDSAQNHFRWLNYVCKKFNHPKPYADVEDMRNRLISPYPRLYNTLGFDWNKDGPKLDALYKQYSARQQKKIVPGMLESLHHLRSAGVRLGIASSNYRTSIDAFLTQNGVRDFFEVITANDDVHLVKPDPYVIVEAIRALGVKPSETVYVGDADVDILASRNVAQVLGAPVPCVAVSYGWVASHRLATLSPTRLVHSPAALTLTLLSMPAIR